MGLVPFGFEVCWEDSSPCKGKFEGLDALTKRAGFVAEVLGSVDSGTLSESGQGLYLQFESGLIDALQAMPSVGGLTAEQLEKVKQKSPEKFQHNFGDPNQFTGITEWLVDGDQRIAAAYREQREWFEQAASVGLGYYGLEEQADEVAPELTARLGLTRDEATTSWVEFLSQSLTQGAYERGQIVTATKECLDLRSRGWIEVADGQAASVLLGNLNYEHRSSCYRLFNLDREWQAHGMDSLRPETPAIKFDREKWEAMIAQLKLDRVSGENTQASAAGGEGVTGLRARDCSFDKPGCHVLRPDCTIFLVAAADLSFRHSIPYSLSANPVDAVS